MNKHNYDHEGFTKNLTSEVTHFAQCHFSEHAYIIFLNCTCANELTILSTYYNAHFYKQFIYVPA